MTGLISGGILRVATRIASTVIANIGRRWLAVVVAIVLIVTSLAGASPVIAKQPISELNSYLWDFGRASDKDFNDWPDDWKKYVGIGYPKYVQVTLAARNSELEQQLQKLDAGLVGLWGGLRQHATGLPLLPPSLTDAIVDRYLRIDLDGGQFKAQSPPLPASRSHKYRFSCQISTKGLRHDTARAEFVFLDSSGTELVVHSTPAFGRTTAWTLTEIDLVRPPSGTVSMLVRLIVERSEDGLEDIRGTIGFDNLRIEEYPQLQVTTDQPQGIYKVGRPIQVTAKVMGLAAENSRIRFRLFDSHEREIATQLLTVQHPDRQHPDRQTVSGSRDQDLTDSEVSWELPRMEPGFYRLAASIEGRRSSTLSNETTFAVIDTLIGGPPHGPFGWSLPDVAQPASPRDLASWLADLGVSWVKYPCWIAADDVVAAEKIATIFSKLQDTGIQTVGMLDVPPDHQMPAYELRGRREMVAAQLFRDLEIWQPLLEPVMTRLTLKVRTWQLGADRDHSFLGRPRLRDSINQISTGLQGFGQPIEVAISWPWLEEELAHGESSWQAICRSSDPPLAAHELDAFLTMREKGTRSEGPRTWLLLDPISKTKYDRESRIRDLVLRMATVRSHRVQAAFVSDPYSEEQGLLRPSGRPDDMLLPWRTTSRLIGDLRKAGSLRLRSGAQNSVFVGSDRAVLMLWSAQPTEEMIYLGEHVQAVDVWGKVTDLPVQPDARQPAQRIAIGPVPIFIIGADPALLAFRMSVNVEPKRFDSLLGQVQQLHVEFANPTRDSLVGTMHVLPPETWGIDSPSRQWETLAGRSTSQSFDIVLSNTAKIGHYEVPIQFELDTVPPKLITVYREVTVGADGLDLKVTTRLLRGSELRVQIEITNHSSRAQSYDCLLFPPPGRQYQRRFVTIEPGEMIRREIYWHDGGDLVGKRMLLRAVEQDGNRVLNYSIDVER